MNCAYADPDDILVDAIVSGAREPKVTERLLDKGDELTLAHALRIGQQYELSQKQVKLFREEDTSVSVITKIQHGKQSSTDIRPKTEGQATLRAQQHHHQVRHNSIKLL